MKYYLQEGSPLHYDRRPAKNVFDRLFEKMAPNKYKRANSILDADIVVWTGGPDISPIIYGDKTIPETHCAPRRDVNDIIAFHFSGRAKLRLGICRGAQLLNSLSGGAMYQHHEGSKEHPQGHSSSHWVMRYSFDNPSDLKDNDAKDYNTYEVTSTHHQIMIPGPKGKVLGVAVSDGFASSTLCSKKIRGGRLGTQYTRIAREPDPSSMFDEEYEDAEVIWYPDTKSLCIQGHPEYSSASPEFINDVQNMIEEVLCAD